MVGSIEKKGISGGQRRRVSVAMEMMKEGDLFLLDGLFLLSTPHNALTL